MMQFKSVATTTEPAFSDLAQNLKKIGCGGQRLLSQ